MFSCTSYPQSNLGDFADFLNPGGDPVWYQLGFPDKASWRAAGSPTQGATVTNPGGSFTPPPGSPMRGGAMIIPPRTPIPPGQSPDGSTQAGGGGGLLSGIPSSYLLIGGVLVLLMVLKK